MPPKRAPRRAGKAFRDSHPILYSAPIEVNIAQSTALPGQASVLKIDQLQFFIELILGSDQ